MRHARSFLIVFLMGAIFLGLPREACAQKPKLHIAVDNGKLTIDAQHVDIHVVLRMLSEKTGTNIVLNPGIEGEVDVFLRDVTLHQAVRAIAWQQGLAVIGNEPLRVGTTGGVLSTLQEHNRESNAPP